MLCPKCNYKLEIDDCYDTETIDDFHIERVIGSCPICEKVFQWEINYKFFNEDELVECQ